MAVFIATASLRDAYGRITRKRYETETDVLATAQTAVAGLLTDLALVSDLGVDSITYSLKDATGATVPDSGANVDVGGTFRGRLVDGSLVAVKLPGVKASFVDTNGGIDVTQTDIAAYLDNFEGAGAFTVSDGESVAEWISGELDR